MATRTFCDWCSDQFAPWTFADVPVKVATNPAAQSIRLDIGTDDGDFCQTCIREAIAHLDMGPVKQTTPAVIRGPRIPRIA